MGTNVNYPSLTGNKRLNWLKWYILLLLECFDHRFILLTFLDHDERKFNQWWSISPPISTWRTITSHLKSLNAKKTTSYDVAILDHG